MLCMPSRRDKVERRLGQIGQTPAWLARQIGKPKQSMYQWLEGSNPREPVVWHDMATALGLPVEIITDDALDLPDPAADRIQFQRPESAGPQIESFVRGDVAILPVWRGTMAGSPTEECIFIQPDSPEYEEVPALLIKGDASKHVLCIAAGTSMSPRIRQGERAIMRFNPSPSPNTIVVAEDPERRRFMKTLRELQTLELHSINGKFPPIKDVRNWTLLGSIVAIIHDYEVGAGNIEWDFGKPLRA